ncbi:YbhB/YbcL family Raf kinase inhibitor-like protein [uncultured Limosilactobacillus sp.]|uniref:YbhB/YbcL family Raf kinase inhibitor-like protein n=1 Tax=uncultured Limosilactobacillus sp. TaxID=2837629 RepID=UPI0025D9425A|nr:YbhB/YbcL family Raf kinase inhibitor-like protein [uncultured Limosilactobacillus sp.]
MKLNVPVTKDGYLPDKYSKYSKIKKDGQPVISFPIEIADIPQTANYLALSLIDYDAVPRTGFPFIHWLAANLPVKNIDEDFSSVFDGPQGMNTWASRFYDEDDEYVTSHYAGPMPPDKPHRYTLSVYALKHAMNIKDKFYYNDFRDELVNNVVDKAKLYIRARA